MPLEFMERVHKPDFCWMSVYSPSATLCFPHGLSCPDLALEQIKKQQQDVLGFLEANKIEFEEKDIAANEENRKWMRENVPEDSRPASGNPLPPRLFNDSRYLGDYEAFFEARENNAVYAFLGLTAPPGSKEAEALAKQQA
ncbi:SH3 domain-binding glutamic acid-rich-like protein [Pitangus sulphuratus]|nr:SH3 domain-binding glutamic acid-rich-like protein [Pitangus sulphuratus]